VVQRYVGIDLHRRRSVIVHKDAAGTILFSVQLANDDLAGFSAELAVLANIPRSFSKRPMAPRTARRSLRCTPPPVRELRELVRYRAKLVALRSGLKAQVHAVLAKEGVAVQVSDLFELAGTRLLETTPLGRSYRLRVDSLRDLILTFGEQIEMLEGEIEDFCSGEKGYLAIQQITGVGRVLAAVFCATLHRFDEPRHRLERSERHLGLNAHSALVQPTEEESASGVGTPITGQPRWRAEMTRHGGCRGPSTGDGSPCTAARPGDQPWPRSARQ
jgi:hypothetical protein